MQSKRYASVGARCVACGCCLKVCPMGAIDLKYGVKANIDVQKCVGCGRCANECPAGVIEILQRGEK